MRSFQSDSFTIQIVPKEAFGGVCDHNNDVLDDTPHIMRVQAGVANVCSAEFLRFEPRIFGTGCSLNSTIFRGSFESSEARPEHG